VNPTASDFHSCFMIDGLALCGSRGAVQYSLYDHCDDYAVRAFHLPDVRSGGCLGPECVGDGGGGLRGEVGAPEVDQQHHAGARPAVPDLVTGAGRQLTKGALSHAACVSLRLGPFWMV
jgi:hypothetical protein